MEVVRFALNRGQSSGSGHAPNRGGASGSGVIATIGNFDGVHIGHQTLLARLAERRGNTGRSLVVTFYPHPSLVLGKAAKLPLITTFRQKLAILASHGVDTVCLVHFTPAFSSLSAEEFIERVLFDGLGVNEIVIGPDARIGRGGSGDSAYIAEYFKRSGRKTWLVPFFEQDGTRVSSGGIRRMLSEGRVKEASSWLKRNFALQGRAIRGAGRGSKLGFPTANLKQGKQILPAWGVYATRTSAAGKTWQSVTNVGIRPTFGEQEPLAESHLLDFDGSPLYNNPITIEFVDRIRGEIKFASAEELKSQIKLDISQARSLLDANK